MRSTTTAIALAFLLASSVAARAESTREARIVSHRTERARMLLRAAAETDGAAASLRHLERATRHLERAYRFDRDASRPDLVRSLNGMTEIHLNRRALKRAHRLNARALQIDPDDAHTRRLAAAIRIAQGSDLEDQFEGATALRRLAERRASQRLPYRPRGFASRR